MLVSITKEWWHGNPSEMLVLQRSGAMLVSITKEWCHVSEYYKGVVPC